MSKFLPSCLRCLRCINNGQGSVLSCGHFVCDTCAYQPLKCPICNEDCQAESLMNPSQAVVDFLLPPLEKMKEVIDVLRFQDDHHSEVRRRFEEENAKHHHKFMETSRLLQHERESNGKLKNQLSMQEKELHQFRSRSSQQSQPPIGPMSSNQQLKSSPRTSSSSFFRQHGLDHQNQRQGYSQYYPTDRSVSATTSSTGSANSSHMLGSRGDENYQKNLNSNKFASREPPPQQTNHMRHVAHQSPSSHDSKNRLIMKGQFLNEKPSPRSSPREERAILRTPQPTRARSESATSTVEKHMIPPIESPNNKYARSNNSDGWSSQEQRMGYSTPIRARQPQRNKDIEKENDKEEVPRTPIRSSHGAYPSKRNTPSSNSTKSSEKFNTPTSKRVDQKIDKLFNFDLKLKSSEEKDKVCFLVL